MAKDQNKIFEGVTNQYIRSLYDELPETIKVRCSNPILQFDLEQKVSEIVKENLISTSGNGNTLYEMPRIPDSATLDKLIKRKKYQAGIFIKELMGDYTDALAGKMVMKSYSPFVEMNVVNQIKKGSTRE